MKAIVYLIILFISVTGFSQEVFLYEVDEYLSMNVPEDAAEGEVSGLTYIQGTMGNILFTIYKTDKASNELAKKADLTKFYEGVKAGTLKASKGKLINESSIEIDNEKAANFSFSMEVDGEPKIVNNYVFFWKKFTYTIQFISTEAESDDYKNSVNTIVESIDLK